MAQEKKVNEANIASGAADLSFGMKFINPEAIIADLGIEEGMCIGDFGCGTGYFSFPLAKKVGQSGRVYSVDILKEKLEAVESQAKVLGLNNLITKRANLEMVGGSKMADNSLDWICLVNMLFQNKKKNLVLEETARVLRLGGKVLVVEWKRESSLGPDKKLRISQDKLSELALDCGMSLLREIQISNFHYGLILEK